MSMLPEHILSRVKANYLQIRTHFVFTSWLFKPLVAPGWFLATSAATSLTGMIFIASEFINRGGISPLGVQAAALASPAPSQMNSLDDNKPELAKLVVDVSGAVHQPGVYSLPKNSRVADALERSGGVTASASSTYVQQELNGSLPVQDSQKIFIPTDAQYNLAQACTQLSERLNVQTNQLKSADGSSAQDLIGNEEVSGLISINQASSAELETLPGVGAARAASIINGRPYDDLQQLVTDKIITAKMLTDLRSQLKL